MAVLVVPSTNINVVTVCGLLQCLCLYSCFMEETWHSSPVQNVSVFLSSIIRVLVLMQGPNRVLVSLRTFFICCSTNSVLISIRSSLFSFLCSQSRFSVLHAQRAGAARYCFMPWVTATTSAFASVSLAIFFLCYVHQFRELDWL